MIVMGLGGACSAAQSPREGATAPTSAAPAAPAPATPPDQAGRTDGAAAPAAPTTTPTAPARPTDAMLPPPSAQLGSPESPSQQPTFPGQARAPGIRSRTAFDVQVVTGGLVNPWAIEPLPGGDLLVTERPGRMRIVSAAGELGAPLQGLPAIDARGQGGLLDVALGPDFATDRTIYWSFTEPRDGGNATSVARGVLSTDRSRVQDVRVIFRALPAHDGVLHFGSRVVFGPDGMLYVTLGERSDRSMRMHAQRLDGHMGKVVRITPEGAAPPDNPFVGHEGAVPETWTLGHRNVQAAAFDAQGRLWTVDMGPQGGDELNLIEKGANYGWPLVTFGEEYSGMAVSGAVTDLAGYRAPVYYWDPVIAPSGAQFYDGSVFPEWRGSLFIGGLRSQRLIRLVIEGDRVIAEEHLLADRAQRIRDVRQGPDGLLYLVTDERAGQVWRIVPRG